MEHSPVRRQAAHEAVQSERQSASLQNPRRHPRHPYRPEWEHYFESRWATKMQNSSKGRAKFYRVWRGQDGMCSTCQEPITKGTSWDVRHIVKRAEGGSDAAGNLQMHHLNCRRNH